MQEVFLELTFNETRRRAVFLAVSIQIHPYAVIMCF
jgi:hypothetical protein